MQAHIRAVMRVWSRSRRRTVGRRGTLAANDIGAIPVVDREHRLVGSTTDP
jgi:hypothetical protein